MNKKTVLLAACTLSLVLGAALFAAQQDKSKRPSPAAKATCELGGGSTVNVDYSSPRAKGRKVFGGIVPYGEVWRAGANEATTFVTTSNLKVGGKEVPAGSYTLFAIPNPDKWTLIISKKTGEWGIPYPGESSDFARVPMTVSKTSAPVEDFTISFSQANGSCVMRMAWENTEASVDITKGM